MNSSNSGRTRTLALTPARAREVLCELANVDEESARYFKRRHGELFLAEIPQWLIRHWAGLGEEEHLASLEEDEIFWHYLWRPLRDRIRDLWQSDVRRKEWGVFSILRKYCLYGTSAGRKDAIVDEEDWFMGAELPPESNCEKVFRSLTAKTAICVNEECPYRYFFSVRSGQKYCCPECSGPAQARFKREWWSKHGQKWRAKRRKPKQAVRRQRAVR